jgi:hypothetical protein
MEFRVSNQSVLEIDKAGNKEWYLNKTYHRIDGPAIEYIDGIKSWYLNGVKYKNRSEWFKALTAEQQESYLWNLNE